MSQFVRITNSGQIHTCEILSQIVNNGELIKLQDFFFPFSDGVGSFFRFDGVIVAGILTNL